MPCDHAAAATAAGDTVRNDYARAAVLRTGAAARAAKLPGPVRELHRNVLRWFVTTGRSPDVTELSALAMSAGVGRAAGVRQLAEADLVHLGPDGRVEVAYPFSGRSTGHSVLLPGEVRVQAMCALDALGIPLMLGRDCVLTSSAAGTGQPIAVEYRNRRWRWDPATTVVVPARRAGHGSNADRLCPSITFHADREAAVRHLASHPELTGMVADQATAVELARLSFGALLT